jgi:hypothetical protein
MACYNHRETNSVGNCKACGRSLCPDCIVEVGKSIACRSRCEDDVRLQDSLIADNIRNAPFVNNWVSSAQSSRFSLPAILVGGGLILSLWGFNDYRQTGQYSSLAAFGVVLMIFGFPRLLIAIRNTKKQPFPAGFCQRCGYDMRGNITGICPECGRKS